MKGQPAFEPRFGRSARCTHRTLSLMFFLGVASSAAVAQTPAPKASDMRPVTAAGLVKLSGKDAKQAEELNQAIEAATKADRWDEAIARAEQLLALRGEPRGRSTSRRWMRSGSLR